MVDELMEALRQAIAKSSLSQEQIAQSAGIDKGVISRLARGERTVTRETADRIADALGYEIRMSVKLVKKKQK